mmetsp:Transcript_5108/g.18262  ORF Transcript_5108/g.18262 Transcript_5108/m.18262 type:complete len:252 (+) Transcript_5108:748-1503(+)
MTTRRETLAALSLRLRLASLPHPGQHVPREEPEPATRRLKRHQRDAQVALRLRAERPQVRVHEVHVIPRRRRLARVQQPRGRVELREAVTWARHELEQLRRAVQKVENLRQEEQHERLAEVAQHADDAQRHPREVRVRVADEHPRRVPVVRQQPQAHGEERPGEAQAEDVRVLRLTRRRERRRRRRIRRLILTSSSADPHLPAARAFDVADARDRAHVQVHDRRRDDDALANLQTVDPRVDVDRVGAEYDE